MDAGDDACVRDLFNALRTGDHGVALESFLGAFYFLQHRSFTILDAREAFVSSSATSERFLSYRDFQYALLRAARAFAPTSVDASDAVLLAKLLDALKNQQDRVEERLDSIRRQLTKPSVLAVLDQHMRKLVQSFQLYGTANDRTPRRQQDQHLRTLDTTPPMTLEGFVDFLNAYFEYEEYLSYQTIAQWADQVVEAFGRPETAEGQPVTLHFPQFLELFCRVASRFHVTTLEREGAQLRKAVESCRLEFSLQLLLEKMAIRILQDAHPMDHHGSKHDSVREVVVPNYDMAIEALSLDEDDLNTRDAAPATTTTLPSMASLLHEISVILDTNSDVAVALVTRPVYANASSLTSKQQRSQSVLFARLPPRTSPPSPLASPRQPLGLERDPTDALVSVWDPPQVTLIREVVTPPPLPTNLLKRLEYAITYQNAGQFHMALGALHQCRSLYRESRGQGVPDETEVRVFFSLMDASIYDSARNDQRALAMYLDALRTAGRLPPHHAGRALVQSCLGCMLFYLNELVLAKRCHEHVLAWRRHSVGDDHVDTATAMNNLACCLSQDPQGSAIEEAYLYLKTAKRIYSERLGYPAHPRVETVARNFARVLASQRTVVVDPAGALARGEYLHVIPGSRFQIKALVPVKKDKGGSGGNGGGGKKKKKKGGKGGKRKK